MVIRWRTTEPCETRLEYRTGHDATARGTHSAALTTDHEVTLTNLAPNTRYDYTVVTNTKVLAGGDDKYSFVTSPRGGDEPIRVWVLGDAGSSGRRTKGEDPGQAQVRDAFLKRYPVHDLTFLLMLGDNAYESGTDEEYQRGFFAPYSEVLRSKVSWPTQGNHDRSANAYYPVFTLPTKGEGGGVPSGSEYYYAFDYGNAHFISLNSELREEEVRASMMAWLRQDLAGNSKPWTIVFWHHPPLSKGHHDSDDLTDSGGRMAWMRENIVPILDAAGVDLVFTGHSHSYERSKFLSRYYGTAKEFNESSIRMRGDGDDKGDGAYTKDRLSKISYSGTVYVPAGSAGQVETGTLDHPAMVVSTASLGSVLLSIDANEAHTTMIGADGEINDSFTIRKEPARPRAVNKLTGTLDEAGCQVGLAWESGGADLSYTVYRSTTPHSRGVELGNTRAPRFTDSVSRLPHETLFYSVRAANGRGKGPWGEAVGVGRLSNACSPPKSGR
jgi:hypothetical protein